MSASNPAALDAQDLILGLDSPGFPFRLVENDERTVFAYRDDELPLFSFRGSECVVRNRDHWRDAVGFLLLHRIYRLRADAIFFHAASVDVNGHGVLFVGPKGAGKSTTALALAARGCPLLGDETACFVPERNLLEPFRRPVGIKPGPRAGAITDALRRASCPIDREIVRIDIDALLTTPRPADVPLRAVVFLEPFQAEPHLKEIRAGRREMAALQPSASSLVNAPRGRRVLQLAQLLSSAKIFRLHPADPDATASRLIGELGDRLS